MFRSAHLIASCILALGSLDVSPGCGSRPTPHGGVQPPSPNAAVTVNAAAATAPQQALGDVMNLLGRRFELLGRAGDAERWELADYEVGEIEELFEDAIPHAELPKEGPTAHIPLLAKKWAEQQAPALHEALKARDRDGFGRAFARAATACNGCHKASEKGFLEIPTKPGRQVPNTDPALPASPDETAPKPPLAPPKR